MIRQLKHGTIKVFVAMSFSTRTRDVWNFGIRLPVCAAGPVCQRIDCESFTGDIPNEIKKRINAADLVIADVTRATPNLWIELGYALGKHRPTLLLCKAGRRKSQSALPFDVSGHKCIFYSDITDLHDKLTAELRGFLAIRN